eukprot:1148808-Pelagomonas_calceolata.AAC.3
MAPIAISVECCVPICDFHQFFWLALLILAIVFPVLSPARTDLVAWMKQNGKHYGYRLWGHKDNDSSRGDMNI